MNIFQRPFCFALLSFWLVIPAIGCRSHKPADIQERPTEPAITSIRVGSFRCDNPITAEAVRNVFIEMLARNRYAKVVREGEADVLVEGTVTLAIAGSSSSRLGGGNSIIAGGSQEVFGNYVSGITALATRDGAVVTSASWGQVIARGKELLPPELVARETADRLLHALYGKGLRKR